MFVVFLTFITIKKTVAKSLIKSGLLYNHLLHMQLLYNYAVYIQIISKVRNYYRTCLI